MSTEPISGLPYQEAGSLQTDVIQNLSLNHFSAWVQAVVLTALSNTPPASPVSGDRHIVGTAPTGAWSGQAGKLAVYRSGWQFYTPSAGWRVNVPGGGRYEYVAGAWVADAAGGSTQGKHAIPVMAGAIAPSVAGGCAALATIASAANQPDIVTLDFDAGVEEYAQFAIPMPKSWNEGTITAQFRWSHAATTTSFDVIWGLQAVAVSDDDPIAVAYGTAQEVTDTGGTTNDLYITAETAAITVGGLPQAGDSVFFRVYRKAAAAGDTLAIDARLHSVVIFITTDADTDA